MPRTAHVAIIVLAVSLLAVVASGCGGGGGLDEEFKQSFEQQGVPVASVEVKVVPHEAQLMADQMILNSHGITDARDEELIHATVTLENGEEISAVKYRDEIYTYNNEAVAD